MNSDQLMFLTKVYSLFYFTRFNFKSFGFRSVLFKCKEIKNSKFISIGKKTIIKKGARLECYSQDNVQTELIIGNGTFINYNFTCLVLGKCTIGNDCLIASDVFISTENHGIKYGNKYKTLPLSFKNVSIGNNVRIGEKCIILPGVVIGDNSVIGAGSVVTKTIPPNVIACGNPCRVIKKIECEDYRDGQFFN